METEQKQTTSFDWKVWKKLLPLLKDYKKAYVLLLIFNLIMPLL